MGKIYFASDFHFGVPTPEASRERELRVIRWLEKIKHDAEELYLVGDIFDFWFDYKAVVPRGYIRFFGKLAELRDAGIPIYYFTGNHDMWMFDYVTDELDIPIYRKPIQRVLKGKRFYIGHGDGLGPGDHLYKFFKKIFSNPFFQWLYTRLHPNFGVGFALYWSRKSRDAQAHDDVSFLGEDKEWLIQYSKEVLHQEHFDYFIFGHRHLPIDCKLNGGKSRYINLGEWLNYNSYAVFDGDNLEIKFFENDEGRVYP